MEFRRSYKSVDANTPPLGCISSSPLSLLQAQSLAAEVLAAIAALPRKKGAALAALADHALPRACEVVRSLQVGACLT